MKNTERPNVATDEVLVFLDNLRASGITNMYGAGPYLVDSFGMTRNESHAALGWWMKTFTERHQTPEVIGDKIEFDGDKA